jgi:hypothetical protein
MPCFVGVRSDPFFADGEGAFHDFQFTGDDTFAGKNILTMALEVPDEMLGAGPEIGVWATSSVRRDGVLVQVDRLGNPSFNPFFVDELKNQFNAGHPADDVANYLAPWSNLLESRGYPPAEARDTVLTVLPDLLHYDRDRPAHYPNGRVLTDDVYDMRMAFLTHGKVTNRRRRAARRLPARVPVPRRAACPGGRGRGRRRVAGRLGRHHPPG